MNYELALELKKAGFPQELVGGYDADYYSVSKETGDVVRFLHRNLAPTDDPTSAKSPSLTELIEACGDEDFELNRADSGEPWTACSRMKRGEGTAPETAVARLWLALNKTANAPSS